MFSEFSLQSRAGRLSVIMAFIYQRRIYYTTIVIYTIIGMCSATDVERSFTTSVASMVDLLEAEHMLVNALDSYASALQNQLEIVHSTLNVMKERAERAAADPEAFLSNPLNAFSLIRRMHSDWYNWELFLKEPIGENHVREIYRIRVWSRPTDQDMVDASMALYRLTEVYDLDVHELAMGLVNNKSYADGLNALDCFTLGHNLLQQNLPFDASFWLYEALEFYEENTFYTNIGFTYQQILLLYAESLIRQSRHKDALGVITAVLENSPHDARILRRKADVEKLLETDVKPMPYKERRVSAYELGCQGKFPYPVSSKLSCRYNKTNTPFLQMAPIKMEEISLDPYLVMFHDVIYDSEIAELKEMSKPVLKRATVFGEDEVSHVDDKRTSQFAWFPDTKTVTTMRINQRISDMTGFELDGSEMLQVMNYGLGGHYDTHYDFFDVPANSSVVRERGDRLATVLFYFNDVDQGGGTVFPSLRLTVYPRKGSAVMWYNLNNVGKGDWRTVHAACPVLVGSKWVCNKWIREREQVFRKPCYK